MTHTPRRWYSPASERTFATSRSNFARQTAGSTNKLACGADLLCEEDLRVFRKTEFPDLLMLVQHSLVVGEVPLVRVLVPGDARLLHRARENIAQSLIDIHLELDWRAAHNEHE